MFKNLLKNIYFKTIINQKFNNCILNIANFSTSIKSKSIKYPKKKLTNKKKIKLTVENPIITHNEISPEIRKMIDSQLTTIESNPLKNAVMEQADANNYLKLIDSSFEGFFFKREFNLKNFNYYLQVLVKQHKISQCEEVISKMEQLGISPDIDSYIQILTGYAKKKDIEKSEKIFELIKSKYILDKRVYNSLLLSYAKNGKTNEALAIIKEMRDEQMVPDTVCYTTLIHSFNKVKDYKKCWELYYECCETNEIDEFLFSYMIRLCGSTHDARKALILYETMELKGFIRTVYNYNSLLRALSSHRDYAEKALETFIKMKSSGIKPDNYTFVYVLKAAAQLGDINTANNIVKEMKILDIPIDRHICNQLIRIYAGAIKIPYVKSEHIDSYIKDSWEIYYYMEKENFDINVITLNALLEVNCAAHKLDYVEGLVIPLYEKHGLELNNYSYELIMKMLLEVRDFEGIFKLYDKIKSNQLVPTQGILNSVLESGIRANKIDFIVESLQKLKEIERKAHPYLLRLITNLQEIPDRLYVELKNELPYNLMGKRRKFRPAQIRESSRSIPGKFRRRGKRIKKH